MQDIDGLLNDALHQGKGFCFYAPQINNSNLFELWSNILNTIWRIILMIYDLNFEGRINAKMN